MVLRSWYGGCCGAGREGKGKERKVDRLTVSFGKEGRRGNWSVCRGFVLPLGRPFWTLGGRRGGGMRLVVGGASRRTRAWR